MRPSLVLGSLLLAIGPACHCRAGLTPLTKEQSAAAIHLIPMSQAGDLELKDFEPDPTEGHDQALSLFRQSKDECVWTRWSLGKETELGHFPIKCTRAEVAWDKSAKTALVFLGDETKSVLFEVNLHDSAVKPAALPPQGELRDLGFDDGGTLHAVTFAAGNSPRTRRGVPGTSTLFVHSSGGAWEPLGSAPTTDEAPIPTKVEDQDGNSRDLPTFGWRSFSRGRSLPPTGAVEDETSEAVRALTAFAAGGNRPLKWRPLKTSPVSALYVREAWDGALTGEFAFFRDHKAWPSRLGELDVGDASWSVRGRYALLTDGNGRDGRLYDVTSDTGDALFQPGDALGAWFWPIEPESPFEARVPAEGTRAFAVSRGACANYFCPLLVQWMDGTAALSPPVTTAKDALSVASGPFNRLLKPKAPKQQWLFRPGPGPSDDPPFSLLTLNTLKVTPSLTALLSISTTSFEDGTTRRLGLFVPRNDKLVLADIVPVSTPWGAQEIERVEIFEAPEGQGLVVSTREKEGDNGARDATLLSWDGKSGALRSKPAPLYAAAVGPYSSADDADAFVQKHSPACEGLKQFAVLGMEKYPHLKRSDFWIAAWSPFLERAEADADDLRACELQPIVTLLRP